MSRSRLRARWLVWAGLRQRQGGHAHLQCQSNGEWASDPARYPAWQYFLFVSNKKSGCACADHVHHITKYRYQVHRVCAA